MKKANYSLILPIGPHEKRFPTNPSISTSRNFPGEKLLVFIQSHTKRAECNLDE